MQESDARRERIRRALEAAEIPFEWLPGDEPVARLPLERQGRPTLVVTVRLRDPILRIVAHDVLPGALEGSLLAERSELNEQWALGRLYFEPGTGTWDASLGFYVRDEIPEGRLPLALLHLSEAVDALGRGEAPSFAFDEPVSPAEAMPTVGRLLDLVGLPHTTDFDGEVVRVGTKAPSGSSFAVELFVAHDAHLLARVCPPGPWNDEEDERTLQAVNRVNRLLDLGTAAVWFGQRVAYGFQALPWRWTPIDAETLRWLVDASGRLMDTIRLEVGTRT